MRVQHLRRSHSRRHKLAALLALFTPGFALADDADNTLRQPMLLNAPIREGDKDIRAVDHTDLVPLPDELAAPLKDGLRPVRVEPKLVSPNARPSTDRAPRSVVVGDMDGWLPRAGRSRVVSPLVVDPTAKPLTPLTPVNPSPGEWVQGTPLLGAPLLGGPSVMVPGSPTHVGDGLARPMSTAANASGGVLPDTSIKLGQSASSTLKIVPNIMEPDPGALELKPESAEPAEIDPTAPQPLHRVAKSLDAKSEGVDNPEQNEPSGELTAEEIAAAEAMPSDAAADGSSEGVLPEATDVGLIPQGDGEPLEPLPAEEPLAEEMPAENGSAEGGNGIDDPQTDSESGADSATSPAPMEVRKLKLRDESSDGLPSGNRSRTLSSGAESTGSEPIALKPLDPSIARMRVGDVEPRSIDDYESPNSGDLVQPPAQVTRSQSNNPIQGDSITSQGELILASGRHAPSIAVKANTMRLKPMIERTLKYYWDHPEDAAERTHWGMMHSIMVFDRDTQIVSRRQKFNAVAWMAGNNPCRNQTLFTTDQYGILPKTGVGLQGHQAQLLAIFGQINVPLNYPVYAAKQKFTVNDILKRELLDCKVGTELTFTLISLAHYCDSDTTWVSSDGQDWSVERVIQEELAQPIVGAACGGTHRLMGFGHILRRRRAEGKPIDGQFERADRYVKDFVKYTWSLQNRDGSMSTSWYEKPEDNGDMDRKIQTTGHMLEMLMTVTPDADLQTPEMLRTVNFMANTLFTERGHEWQIGPKGHALRSLAIYYQRVFGGPTPWRPGSGSRTAGASSVRSVR